VCVCVCVCVYVCVKICVRLCLSVPVQVYVAHIPTFSPLSPFFLSFSPFQAGCSPPGGPPRFLALTQLLLVERELLLLAPLLLPLLQRGSPRLALQLQFLQRFRGKRSAWARSPVLQRCSSSPATQRTTQTCSAGTLGRLQVQRLPRRCRCVRLCVCVCVCELAFVILIACQGMWPFDSAC
jgi:hypothetical protein